MSDNEAKVRITADASGVQPGVQQAAGEIEGLAPLLQQLNVQFAELAAEMRAAMTQGAAASAEMAQELRVVEEETKRETLSLREMALSVHEGVESFNKFKLGLKEIGEAWMAAFFVEEIAEWGKKFAENAEHVQHLGSEFGMATSQVQALGAVATATGISLDTIVRGMGILDKNLFAGGAKASIFKQLGIEADNAKDQVKLLLSVADKFEAMEDGPKKAALAMQLFGRAGKEMIPILDLGAKGIQALMDKAQEYDVANTAVSDRAQQKGMELAESINESKLSFQGLTNVLGDTFAPILTEIVDGMNRVISAMIESYNHGGIVAVVFKAIGTVIEAVGAVVNAFADVMSELWSVVSSVVGAIAAIFIDAFGIKAPGSVDILTIALNLFKDTITVVKDYVIEFCEVVKGGFLVLMDTLVMFGNIARAALNLDWDGVTAAWKAGTTTIANHVIDAAGKIKAAMDESNAAVAAGLRGEALPGAGHAGLKLAGGGAGGSFDPDIGHHSKEKKPKDDLVQRLDDELTAKKLAWAMEQDAQGTAHAFSLQEEADYWSKILERTNLSAKDRAAIETKYLAVHGQIVKERWTIEEDGYRQQLADADKNEAAKLALAQKHLDDVGKMFGLESTEYARAQAEIVKIKRDAAHQIEEIDRLSRDAEDKASLAQITAAENLAKFRVAMGVETNAAMLAQDRDFENQRYAIERAAAARALANVDPARDPVKYAQASGQIEALDIQHQAKLTQIDQQAVLQRTAIERTAINSLSSSWAQAIGKMVTLQQGFAATVKSMWQGLQQAIGNAIASIIEHWLAKQLAALIIGGTASKATAAGQIANQVALAGAGGIASMSAAPFPIDLGAPAFGASMAAMAGAYSSLLAVPSGAGGIWEVPGGLTMLHEKEMVLPAWAAEPMRAMIGGGAANMNAPMAGNDSGGSGGFHFHDHSGRMTPGQIMDNRHALAKALKRAHREGAFAGTSISF